VGRRGRRVIRRVPVEVNRFELNADAAQIPDVDRVAVVGGHRQLCPVGAKATHAGAILIGVFQGGDRAAGDAAGVPDLALLLRRHRLTNPWKIAQAWRYCSVRYVLFDLLYYRGRCLIQEPLSLRRTVLAEACSRLDTAEVVFSTGVVGAGTALFAAAVAQGHEGIVAKLLTSRYRPGRRSAAWLKIKPRQQ
jgi:ATP-dependent DNA ligase